MVVYGLGLFNLNLFKLALVNFTYFSYGSLVQISHLFSFLFSVKPRNK